MLGVPLCRCWCQRRQGMLVLPWHTPTTPPACCGIASLAAGTELVGAPSWMRLSPRGQQAASCPPPASHSAAPCSPWQEGLSPQQGCVYSLSPALSPPPAAGLLSPTSPQQSCASCPCPVLTVLSGGCSPQPGQVSQSRDGGWFSSELTAHRKTKNLNK